MCNTPAREEEIDRYGQCVGQQEVIRLPDTSKYREWGSTRQSTGFEALEVERGGRNAVCRKWSAPVDGFGWPTAREILGWCAWERWACSMKERSQEHIDRDEPVNLSQKTKQGLAHKWKGEGEDWWIRC